MQTPDEIPEALQDAYNAGRSATLMRLKSGDMTLIDQSKLVTASIAGVLREGAIAAGLTGLMILFFLGSWRSTLIVLISIPLSILTSIVILYFMGHTLNTMTLGGMALAVGILVDNSTVTIENTHRLRSAGMNLAAATLHGSAGIAVPTTRRL